MQDDERGLGQPVTDNHPTKSVFRLVLEEKSESGASLVRTATSCLAQLPMLTTSFLSKKNFVAGIVLSDIFRQRCNGSQKPTTEQNLFKERRGSVWKNRRVGPVSCFANLYSLNFEGKGVNQAQNSLPYSFVDFCDLS